MVYLKPLLSGAVFAAASSASALLPRQANNTNSNPLDSCPGYEASNVQNTGNSLTADLTLAGPACNAYGDDLVDLRLSVTYETDTRIHVLIEDAAQQVYQVPSEAFERPDPSAYEERGDHGNGRPDWDRPGWDRPDWDRPDWDHPGWDRPGWGRPGWGRPGKGHHGKGPHGKPQQPQHEIEFHYETTPFSFSIRRSQSGEVLFDTSAASLVFESQYLRLRTSLPESPSLYGLGEHTDPFMLNTTDYTRTLWNRDAYGIPPGTNLYASHPVYYDHRESGTHAVFLLNSNGMDINIDQENGQYLEYNTVGGVFDFYFMAGPTPVEAAQQYSEVVGKSAMFPYWGLGFHQCRYGYRDIYNVAEVIANYSAAGIPLETMWTDIDYMDRRRIFTTDPLRYPVNLMQEVVDYLHDNQQHYIVMVDPAVAADLDPANPAYGNGIEADAFLKEEDGSLYEGVVWPGVTVFPDWFAAGTQQYWNSEFETFFNPETGIDIDGLWIDMNEASNFCDYPCQNPEEETDGNPPRPPPVRLGSPRPIPGFSEDFQPQCKSVVTFNVEAQTFFGENIGVYGSAITLGNFDEFQAPPLSPDNYPIWSAAIDMPANTEVTYSYLRFQPDGSYIYEEDANRTITTGDCGSTSSTDDTITSEQGTPPSRLKSRSLDSRISIVEKRQSQTPGNMLGLPGRDLINPQYTIDNEEGSLSNHTLRTNLTHANGMAEYDLHNLYGSMMSESSRLAMLNRRPELRPLVITRSNFAGSGRQVGKWGGDNVSSYAQYLLSISTLLQFGSLFQTSMVGSDVCGFVGDTTPNLCARWAMLGAFQTFYRNHNADSAASQEFYLWPVVAEAARNAIDIRYRLLDYIYTAMNDQHKTGTPVVSPMFFAYPNDPQVNSLAYQYFYGPSILVAPVTAENANSSQVYLPDDIFYDFYTHEAIRGTGEMLQLDDVPLTSIPLFYKGGSIVAQRSQSANTTTELRNQPFTIIVAPGLDGTASGDLYLDDGVSIEQAATSYIHFSYGQGRFSMSGDFGYDAGVAIESVVVLGGQGDGEGVLCDLPLTGPCSLQL